MSWLADGGRFALGIPRSYPIFTDGIVTDMTGQSGVPDHEDIQALLQATGNLITQEGWTPSDAFPVGPPYSLRMAMPAALAAMWPDKTSTAPGWAIKVQVAAIAALELALRLSGVADLMAWEHEPGRTVKEVLLAIDEAGPQVESLDLPSIWTIDQTVLDRLGSGLARQRDVERQMRVRSGPTYELSRERSRIVSEAWRAAGRPTRPLGGRADRTAPEWEAWRAWRREKARLHRELGWEPRKRSGGEPSVGGSDSCDCRSTSSIDPCLPTSR